MNNNYSYEKITATNQAEAFLIYLANADYFALTKEIPTMEQVHEDARSLPTGLDLSHKHFLLIRQNEIPVAVLDFLRDYPQKKEAFLGLLLVKEKGRGHGREIVSRLEDQLMKQGYTKLILAVLQNNQPGLIFWRKLGFQESGKGTFPIDATSYPVLKFEKILN